MAQPDTADVLVVGGGVAGRSAAVFTARHGLATRVLDAGNPLLRRNAHLENFPGFPAGVDARQLLDLMREQLERAGAEYHRTTVTALERTDDGFTATTVAGERHRSSSVIAATKNAVDYLEPLDDVEVIDEGKAFVATDDRGRTGVRGLYAAGRLARKPHQAVVAAGHGAEVAVTLLEDLDRPFYHDWVAPDGYFTGRDRDLPPGCEEIGLQESRRRERESMAVMRDAFAEPHPDEPEQHPRVADE